MWHLPSHELRNNVHRVLATNLLTRKGFRRQHRHRLAKLNHKVVCFDFADQVEQEIAVDVLLMTEGLFLLPDQFDVGAVQVN